MSHRSLIRRHGFTLIELLVVIGIIAVLGTIVGVVVSKATKTADKFRLGGQMRQIEAGLEAYKSDFQAYPTTLIDDAFRLPAGATAADDVINLAGARGARSLCKALMGPCKQNTVAFTASNFDTNQANQDGADGLGFRVLPRSGVFQYPTASSIAGKVYGPYLSSSQFKMSKTDATGMLLSGGDYDDTTVLLDANGKPILYYPLLNSQATLTLANGYVSQTDPSSYATVSPTPMYRGTDNSAWLSVPNLLAALGDANADGGINVGATTGETAAVKGKYILWSAGSDGIYGPNPNASGANKLDDVTNYQGE